MTRQALIAPLVFALILVYTGRISAACWQITLRDGGKTEATEIWNLSSKLEETPQGFLLGRLDGEETQIPVAHVQSIEFRDTKKGGWRGWLKGSGARAQIKFSDGSRSDLDMELNIFYRTKGEKKHLPASTIMGEGADNGGMDLNIFYRAKGGVKQFPVTDISSIERCSEVREANGGAEIVVQKAGSTKAEPLSKATKSAQGDVLELVNGDKLSGHIITTPVRWETAYGVLEINRADIRGLALSGEDRQRGTVELLSGDHIAGRLLNQSLTIHLSIGQSLEIPVEKIRLLELRATANQPRSAHP